MSKQLAQITGTALVVFGLPIGLSLASATGLPNQPLNALANALGLTLSSIGGNLLSAKVDRYLVNRYLARRKETRDYLTAIQEALLEALLDLASENTECKDCEPWFDAWRVELGNPVDNDISARASVLEQVSSAVDTPETEAWLYCEKRLEEIAQQRFQTLSKPEELTALNLSAPVMPMPEQLRNILRSNLADRVDQKLNNVLSRSEYEPIVMSLQRKFQREVLEGIRSIVPPQNASEHCTAIPPRNDYFYGREKVLEKVFETLQFSRMAVLHSAGGYGKTQIALEYAHRNKCGYETMLWVSADGETQLQTSFIELATILGLGEMVKSGPNAVRSSVKLWLQNHHNWLLVFDNAVDITLVLKFLPSERSERDHILITTRLEKPEPLGRPVSVPIPLMDESESVGLLLSRTARNSVHDTEIQAAKLIAKTLGNLPLALEQVAAYIATHDTSFTDYLRMLKEYGLKQLEKTKPEQGAYRDSVKTTWLINFEQIQTQKLAARDVLFASAWLSEDPIPFTFLERGWDKLGDAITDAVGDSGFRAELLPEILSPIAQYSLAQVDYDACTYQIHQLVQAVIREQLENQREERVWATRAAAALHIAYSSADLGQNIEAHLAQHVLALERHTREASLSTDPIAGEELAKCCNAAGRYLSLQGRPGDSIPLAKRAYKIISDVLPFDHSVTLLLRRNLVFELVTNETAFQEAEHLCQLTLKAYIRLGNIDNPEVAETLNMLGLCRLAQQQPFEAEALFRMSLEMFESHYGEGSPETVHVLNNLASTAADFGAKEEAKRLHNRAINIYEQTDDWFSLAIALDNLAVFSLEVGEVDRAEELNARALAILSEHLGLNHVRLSKVHANRAVILLQMQRYDEVEAELSIALGIKEHIYGNTHDEVLSILERFIALYKAQGRVSDVEDMLVKSLTIVRLNHGPNSPAMIAPLEDITGFYQSLNRFEEAIDLQSEALRIAEAMADKDILSVAGRLHNLGDCYMNNLQYAKAEEMFEKAFVTVTTAEGTEHPIVAAILNNLALVYAATGRYQKAEEAHMICLRIRNRVFGPTSLAVLQTHMNLSEIFISQSKYADAEIHAQEGLRILDKLEWRPDHPNVQRFARWLVISLDGQGRANEASLVRDQYGTDKLDPPEAQGVSLIFKMD